MSRPKFPALCNITLTVRSPDRIRGNGKVGNMETQNHFPTVINRKSKCFLILISDSSRLSFSWQLINMIDVSRSSIASNFHSTIQLLHSIICMENVMEILFLENLVGKSQIITKPGHPSPKNVSKCPLQCPGLAFEGQAPGSLGLIGERSES